MQNVLSIRWVRWVVIPVLGLFSYLSFFLMSPTDGIVEYYTVYGWTMVLIDVPTVIIASVLVFELGRMATGWLDRRMPWHDRPLRRMLVQFLTQALIASLVVTLAFCFWDAFESQQNQTPDYIFMMGVVIGSLVSLLLTAVYVALHFLQQWKTTLVETERLKRESVEARFEVLKSQLDPHFLFNNLNTLTYLVDDNPRAVAFVENLSLVYRYILQNRERTLVLLADELRLADAYVFLLQQRFGEGIQVQIDVPTCDHDRQIPPMTLQLLIENAVKHNVVSEQQPLTLYIGCTDQQELVIRNTLRPRVHVPGKTGIGLRNIKHRYDLLTTREPTVRKENGNFVVILPLLSQPIADPVAA